MLINHNITRFFIIFLSLGAVAWVVTTLPAEYVRLKHRPLLEAMQRQEEVVPRKVDVAIGNYQLVADFNFCHRNFYKDLTALYMMRFAKQEAERKLSLMDDSLFAAMRAIDQHLDCQPKDGNGWLNKAIIHIQQAGFNSDALRAYKRSAEVSPREAWLAEKRSKFALGFFLLFDDEARAIAVNDIKVLKTASTNRRRAFRNAVGVKSLDGILEQMKELSNIPSP